MEARLRLEKLKAFVSHDTKAFFIRKIYPLRLLHILTIQYNVEPTPVIFKNLQNSWHSIVE